MVDESHSAGVVGKTGKGVTELFNIMGDVDIITGTLGKAFGGAIGGFTTGRKEIIEMLRQRSRPYLFPTQFHQWWLHLAWRLSTCCRNQISCRINCMKMWTIL